MRRSRVVPSRFSSLELDKEGPSGFSPKSVYHDNTSKTNRIGEFTGIMRYSDAESQGKDSSSFNQRARLQHEELVKGFLASRGYNPDAEISAKLMQDVLNSDNPSDRRKKMKLLAFLGLAGAAYLGAKNAPRGFKRWVARGASRGAHLRRKYTREELAMLKSILAS